MTKRTEPYAWVTWVTGLLAGDKHCEWAAWFRANYQDFAKLPKDTNLTVWKAEHNEMLRQRVNLLKQAPGYRVTVENQNKFNLRGKVATLGGTPDIVAVSDSQALVIDCKTGQPRDSDVFQVLVYMLVLPLTHPACKNRILTGELQYKTNSVLVEPARLTAAVKELIKTTIARLAESEPARTPSFDECRWCDIAECPDRVNTGTRIVACEELF